MKKFFFAILLVLGFFTQTFASDFDSNIVKQEPYNPRLYLDYNNQKNLEEKDQKSRIYFVYYKNPGDSEYYKLFIKSVEWTAWEPGNDDPFFGFVRKADENFLLCISGLSDLVIYRKDNPTWKLDFVVVGDRYGIRLRFPFG